MTRKPKHQNQVKNLCSLETQFNEQTKQFKEQKIPQKRIDFYFVKMQSEKLMDIHFGLLGMKQFYNNEFNNEFELDEIQTISSQLIILLLNFVQKDIHPEITLRSLSILKYISETEPLLFIQNYGIKTILQAHLLRNSEYFLKIIKILLTVISKFEFEERDIFRQVGLVNMIIDFIKKSLNPNIQSKLSSLLMVYINETGDYDDYVDAFIFYEDCLTSQSFDLQHIYIGDLVNLLDLYCMDELNPKIVENLFFIYEICEQKQQKQIIQYFEMVMLQQFNDYLIQLGFFDFLYEIMNLNILNILTGIDLILQCIRGSEERANILVNHQIFQYILQQCYKFELFGQLQNIIHQISLKSLYNLIVNGFLRIMVQTLNKQNQRYREKNLNSVLNIIKYIINKGKVKSAKNRFLIEIKNQGILKVLESANVLNKLSQSVLLFENSLWWQIQHE